MDRSAAAVGAFLGPVEIRALAEQLGLRPTKQLGQNFLHDANTVRRIVRAAGLPAEGEGVLEVGPGLGSLTLGLLAAGADVVAVEVDERLAAALPGTVRHHQPRAAGRLRVVAADAMRVADEDVRVGAGDQSTGPTALVANLPYNVAVPVLLHLLAVVPTLRHGLVMVQKEVAERLTAPPGGRVYGVPSAKLAWYSQARPAGDVGRRVFWPEPRIDSGLVAFGCHAPPGDEALRRSTFRLVDAAFAQRRKTLRGALAGLLGSPGHAEALLVATGIDPSARGETLGIEAYAALARTLRARGDELPGTAR